MVLFSKKGDCEEEELASTEEKMVESSRTTPAVTWMLVEMVPEGEETGREEPQWEMK